MMAKIVDPHFAELFGEGPFPVVGKDPEGRTLLRIENEDYDFVPQEIEIVREVKTQDAM